VFVVVVVALTYGFCRSCWETREFIEIGTITSLTALSLHGKIHVSDLHPLESLINLECLDLSECVLHPETACLFPLDHVKHYVRYIKLIKAFDNIILFFCFAEKNLERGAKKIRARGDWRR